MKKMNIKRKIISLALISSMLMGIIPIKSYATHPPIPQRKVVRIAGKDRFETAEKIAEKVIELGGNANEYALANGLNFPDALSGGAYCGKFKLPLLLTDGKSVPEKFRDKPVTIFGGEGVVNPEGINLKKRLAGKDRFETSYKIAEDGFPNTIKMAITTGYNFPDALSLSPLCARSKAPLLLYDTINTNKSQPIKPYYDKIFNQVQNKYHSETYLAGIEKPNFQTNTFMEFTELKGRNRFETNSIISDYVEPQPKVVIVANGHKFADALAGASLSGVLNNAPIVLTDADKINYATHAYLKNPLIETVYILGGESAVSPLVEREISGRDVDESVTSYMPKWSVAIHNIVYEIKNVKGNSQMDFSNVQLAMDLLKDEKAWVNSSALFNEYKVHGDGKSFQFDAHATDFGWYIETAQFIYLSDKNGNVKKYIRAKEITKQYNNTQHLVDKDEWSIRKGTYGDCVCLCTCTGNGDANVGYEFKIHVFVPAK